MTYATLATEEVYYDLEIPSEVAFKVSISDMKMFFAQTVEIANAGNVEISNIKAVLAGEKKRLIYLGNKWHEDNTLRWGKRQNRYCKTKYET